MFPQFDPSKMDPKVLMELSGMIQSLPPNMINRMQSIMHNAMAGFDVTQPMAEFEKELPPGFREKLALLMSGQPQAFVQPMQASPSFTPTPATIDVPPVDMNVREARITVLKAVAEGRMPPEEAEKLLFPD
jgi:hypothetical protein